MLYDDSVEDAARGALTSVRTATSWFSAAPAAPAPGCSVQLGGMNGKQMLLLEAAGS